MKLHAIALLFAVVACAALLGCVTEERHEVFEAREAYAACVEAHSAAYEDCQLLQSRVLAAEERYEHGSRRAWSCDPRSDECPIDR